MFSTAGAFLARNDATLRDISRRGERRIFSVLRFLDAITLLEFCRTNKACVELLIKFQQSFKGHISCTALQQNFV